MNNKAERLARLLINLTALGFTFAEAQRLRRISSTLHHWATAECNGEIQRDGEEDDSKPYRVHAGNYGQGWTETRYPIPDRETGARKQLAAIMEAHPKLWHYVQGDPRGCSLYVGRKADLPKMDAEQIERMEGKNAAATPASRLRAVIRSHYTRGVAVCV